MEISILHIYKSTLGPLNSDGSNTMDGSNLFESPANFPYIFKLKKNLSLEHWYLEQSKMQQNVPFCVHLKNNFLGGKP
jgi:hypothetical protein